MKLLFCPYCGDVFSLNKVKKICSCRRSSGQYEEDGINAVYSGSAVPIGFNNASFLTALAIQPKEGKGEEFTAFIIPEKCETFIKLEYDRPNEPLEDK